MAKSTHAQEATTGDSASFTEDELNDPVPPPIVTITRMNLGGEVSSPVNQEDGTDSSTFSENVSKSSKSQSPSHPKPAPMTDSHSSRSGESQVDYGAPTTDGDTQKMGMVSGDPFQEAADEVIPEEEDDEESEEESEPTVTAPKPAPRGKRAPRSKPAQGNPKEAQVRSTGDDFDF